MALFYVSNSSLGHDTLAMVLQAKNFSLSRFLVKHSFVLLMQQSFSTEITCEVSSTAPNSESGARRQLSRDFPRSPGRTCENVTENHASASAPGDTFYCLNRPRLAMHGKCHLYCGGRPAPRPQSINSRPAAVYMQ